ncbi:12234_t:CDS:1, partial [Rhizophagus irregularis]
ILGFLVMLSRLESILELILNSKDSESPEFKTTFAIKTDSREIDDHRPAIVANQNFSN